MVRRRDFFQIAAAGACSIAVAARAERVARLRAIPIAHAATAAGGLELDVHARVLDGAERTRHEVDAAAYLAEFGLSKQALGVRDDRVSIVTTELDGALAEVMETNEHCVVIWDGVAYRLEAA
jgi:hypothetical protein